MTTTTLRTLTAIGVFVLTATSAVRSAADDATPTATARKEKTYTGTVLAVNPQEHVLKVRGSWLSSKSFNLGDPCTYTFLNDQSGTVNDLRPGQRVMVRYQNVDGVLVAGQVRQQPMTYEGRVKTIDAAAGALTVHGSRASKTFRLPEDCKVVLRNSKSGALADVQPGNLVAVTYETPDGTATARQVAQTSATFTGTLTAIDLGERTLKAKGSFSGAKKFHLADNCAILVNGKSDAELRDLRPGENLVLSYDDVNGVNVVNRIADAGTSAEPATTAAEK